MLSRESRGSTPSDHRCSRSVRRGSNLLRSSLGARRPRYSIRQTRTALNNCNCPNHHRGTCRARSLVLREGLGSARRCQFGRWPDSRVRRPLRRLITRPTPGRALRRNIWRNRWRSELPDPKFWSLCQAAASDKPRRDRRCRRCHSHALTRTQRASIGHVMA